MKPKYKIPSMKDIKKIKPNGLKVVSTFSGGGGSSVGYRMAGYKVLWANEFVPEAAKTYKANHPDSILDERDIKTIKPEEILKAIGMKSGDIDLLDGSPPCSAFSLAGSREKNWGKEKVYSDTKQTNVEDLFFEYARILDGLQPKVFVAENVEGLVRGTTKGYFKEILEKLKGCGYNVTAKIINAKWLGVPQHRKRLIFVGVRSDLWKPEFKSFTHPKPFTYLVTLKEAFEGLVFTEEDAKNTDISGYSVYPYLKELSLNSSQLYTMFSLSKGSPYGQSLCITATTARGAAQASHWDNRMYTVSETKRIMSVPDDYILTGAIQKQTERLGRMVPPLVMKEIASGLTGILNGHTN